MKRLSVAGVLLLAVALWGGYVWVRHVGVVMERQRRTADSLHTAQQLLATQSTAALALRDSLATVERQRLTLIRAQQAALEAANRLLGAKTAQFRSMLADSLRAQFDSLEALHNVREASLSSQRDSALGLFSRAAASRDTLAALLRSSQAQTQALSVALLKAQRVPFFSRPSVRIGMLAGAFLAGNLLKR